MNYYTNIIAYITKNLLEKFNIKVGIVSNDRQNVQFITNNSSSRIINIYQFTSKNDIDNCIKLIGYDFINPITI